MLVEIAQIKRYLAKVHNLPIENPDNPYTCRVVGQVPDGEHIIPLGGTETPFHVTIKNDRISIGEEAIE